MSNIDTTRILVEKLLRSIDTERAKAIKYIEENYLLPKDPNEEPFFMVMKIDWSKYGRMKA
jgi:hypothetical protein